MEDENLHRTSYNTVSWTEEIFSKDIIMDQLKKTKVLDVG